MNVVKKQASRHSLPDLPDQADQADLPDQADQAEMGGRTAGPNLPSTRAGGQDDGSYTNSLKLHVCLPIYMHVDLHVLRINSRPLGLQV